MLGVLRQPPVYMTIVRYLRSSMRLKVLSVDAAVNIVLRGIRQQTVLARDERTVGEHLHLLWDRSTAPCRRVAGSRLRTEDNRRSPGSRGGECVLLRSGVCVVQAGDKVLSLRGCDSCWGQLCKCKQLCLACA